MGSQRVLIQNNQTSKASSKLIFNSSFLSTQGIITCLFTLFLTGCISKICFAHSNSSLSVEDTFQIPNQIPAESSPELDRQCSGIPILQHCPMVPELICPSTLWAWCLRPIAALLFPPASQSSVRSWQVINNRDSYQYIQHGYTGQGNDWCSWQAGRDGTLFCQNPQNNAQLKIWELFLSGIFHFSSECE